MSSRFVVTENPVERFNRKYLAVPESGCWLWDASVRQNGYGQFRMGDTTTAAHRASWQLFRGDIPAGLFVLHKCDVRCCVNPSHLFLGTAFENSMDALVKGRIPKGAKSASAKLSEQDVLAIRESNQSQGSLAKQYGVIRQTISKIQLRLRWQHL